ncbi:MAG: hypothetical protein ACP5JO_08845 [Candidatus Ratteibacteria bacterium]
MEEFGKKAALYVTKAWRHFSDAWESYPFSIPFLYWSPVNYATTYPFDISAGEIEGVPSWLSLPRDRNGHLAVAGNNLKQWIKPFSADFVQKVFKKLLSEWQKGIDVFKKGTEYLDEPRYQKELNLAVRISLLIRSTVNIIEFYKLLKGYRKGKGHAKMNLIKLLKEEISIAEQDRDIIKRNKDFGYHPEAHEYFVKDEDLSYKITILKRHLED